MSYIIVCRICICWVATLWKNEKFSLTKNIVRQINSLVTYLVKPLLSRNFCQKCVRENSRNFHTVSCNKNLQNIRAVIQLPNSVINLNYLIQKSEKSFNLKPQRFWFRKDLFDDYFLEQLNHDKGGQWHAKHRIHKSLLHYSHCNLIFKTSNH